MIYACSQDLGISLDKFVWVYHEDPDYAEEQIYAYKGILDELKKLFQKDGKDELAAQTQEIRDQLKVPS
jgi:hypothetical protein